MRRRRGSRLQSPRNAGAQVVDLCEAPQGGEEALAEDVPDDQGFGHSGDVGAAVEGVHVARVGVQPLGEIVPTELEQDGIGAAGGQCREDVTDHGQGEAADVEESADEPKCGVLDSTSLPGGST